jgi:ERCC4-type nuclease
MAPTVTASAKSRTTTTTARPKKGLKAKCAENQANLDMLVEKKGQLRPADKFGYTLKRAIESLQKSKEPVASYKEALKLAYVGPAIALIMFPDIPDKDDAAPQPRKRKAKTKETAAASSSTSPNCSPTTKQPQEASNAPAAAKRSRRESGVGAGEAAILVRSALAEKPTAKETAYQNALSQAENYKGKKLTWRAILIVDGRERKSEHMQAKCQMSGIPCEERMLPIGDMGWIGQGIDPQSKKIVCELMLGTIIERKTTSDLVGSLFGTRYFEQRLRLQYSGVPQVLFLIEGDLSKEQFNCPAETLHTAVMETRLHLGFQIVQTEHMDGTVAALKRIHRRVLQRSFPNAFGKTQEALPDFAEAGVAGVDRRESLPQQENNRRRRKRKRLQSLMEMTFDTEPVPPLGESRFVTYKELKAKVERDREAGRQTIGSIHAAMLKQVSTISGKKVQALARAYPTNERLMKAFSDEPDDDARKSMVTDLLTHDPNQAPSARVMKVGPRSSAELYVAYGMNCSEDESEASETDEKGRRSSYIKLVEEAQAQPHSKKETARLSFGSQNETEGTALYASHSSSVLREKTFASSSVARAKPSIHDAAFWDNDGDEDEDRSVSELLPTANNNKTSSAYTASTSNKATAASWSPDSKQKANSPGKQRFSMSSQEEIPDTSLYASHSSSVMREAAVASSRVVPAKPSIHDAAFWDDDGDDDDHSVSEYLLTANNNTNNNKASSAYTTGTNTATTAPWSPEESKQKAKSPGKQRFSMSSEEDTSLYASHSSSVLRETAVASSVAPAIAKSSIQDAAFWDGNDDNDRILPTANSNNNKTKTKTSSAYTTSTTSKATTSSWSPGSKENACVDLTDDSPVPPPRKKPAYSSSLATLSALDSSDDEDSLFLERQSTKQKPADGQRFSFSSSSTTSTVLQTTAATTKSTKQKPVDDQRFSFSSSSTTSTVMQTTAATTKSTKTSSFRNTQEVIEID